MAMAVGIVGSLVGGMIGGPLGAQIGGMIGSVIGNAMFPPPAQEGPKLSDLKVTTSSYGVTLPIVFGAARISGNMIWSTDKIEHKQTQSVGKGGGQQQNTYTYTISSAFALCQGEIAGVRRIWANRELIYDVGDASSSTVPKKSKKFNAKVRTYLGTETQLPDAFMQGKDGVDATPAYRGTAYIVLQDLDLTPWGGAMPNFEFEVCASGFTTVPYRKISTALYKFNQLPAGQREAFQFKKLGDTPSSIGIPYSGKCSEGEIFPDGVAGGSVSFANWIVSTTGDFIGFKPKQKPELIAYRHQIDGTKYDYACTIDNHGGFTKIRGAEVDGTFSGGGFIGLPWPGNRMGAFPPPVYGHADLDQIVNFFSAPRYFLGMAASSAGNIIFGYPGDPNTSTPIWMLAKFTNNSWTVVDSGEIVRAGSLLLPGGLGSQGYLNIGSCVFEEDGKSLWSITGGDGQSMGGISCYQIGEDKVMREILHYNWFGDGIHNQTMDVTGGQTAPGLSAGGGVCYVIGNAGINVYTRNKSFSADAKVSLGNIVSSICQRSGMIPEEIDVSQLTDEVSGIAYGGEMTYRSMIEALSVAYFFDAVESDGVLRFVKRGNAVSNVIREDDMAARDANSLGEPIDPIKKTRQQEYELPKDLSVDYFALDAGYQDGSQISSFQGTMSVNTMKLQLPIVLTDNQAKSIADKNIYLRHAARDSYEFSTNMAFSSVIPTDVVTIYKDGRPFTARIIKRTDNANGVIDFSAQSEDISIYSQKSIGGTVLPGLQNPVTAGPTMLVLVDMPPINFPMARSNGVLLAANGYDLTWDGATILKYNGASQSYVPGAGDIVLPSKVGAVKIVGGGGSSQHTFDFGMFDESSYVDVMLANENSELDNATFENVSTNGTNLCYVGGEMVAFRNAEQIGLKQYRLTGLVRGCIGTEDIARKQASIGSDFVLVDESTFMVAGSSGQSFTESVSIAQKEYSFKAVTFGELADASIAKTYPFTSRNRMAMAPVQVSAYREANGDWKFKMQHRVRANEGPEFSGSLEGSAVQIEIYTAAGVLKNRVIGPSSTYFMEEPKVPVYPAYLQNIDFGGVIDTIYFRVYVTNSYGKSPEASEQMFVATYTPPTLNGGPA